LIEWTIEKVLKGVTEVNISDVSHVKPLSKDYMVQLTNVMDMVFYFLLRKNVSLSSVMMEKALVYISGISKVMEF
jgi:hypothetical protein